jgi:hypothetical protein
MLRPKQKVLRRKGRCRKKAGFFNKTRNPRKARFTNTRRLPGRGMYI